ncbi:hypothetical protein Cva_00845 [Caedimonas varicaedens]|uniref:Uncharacterized protein n=1 Tax=Caedimonas varicaedens TaxID=1629334 RepID=A0A0K8MCK3_9PROT|nr:hypothetical protein Cva_00845 [Caedimonas varicaedens]
MNDELERYFDLSREIKNMIFNKIKEVQERGGNIKNQAIDIKLTVELFVSLDSLLDQGSMLFTKKKKTKRELLQDWI